jgi:type II secretory ATPase GspE/PulE/Tfp pilus assembly ATPase PilB-like protein
MAKKVGKIEQFNLTERVLAMATKDGKPSRIITRILKNEGYSIDQATISRFLKKMRELAQPTVSEVVEKHVLLTVPADLEALEEMERHCLERAREMKGDFSHRMAALYIEDDLEKWVSLLGEAKRALAERENADPEEKRDAIERVVESIIRQALIYVTNDLVLEKMRNAARRTASQIIDLKLKYSGILGADASGSIVFKDRDEDETSRDADLRKTGTMTV